MKTLRLSCSARDPFTDLHTFEKSSFRIRGPSVSSRSFSGRNSSTESRLPPTASLRSWDGSAAPRLYSLSSTASGGASRTPHTCSSTGRSEKTCRRWHGSLSSAGSSSRMRYSKTRGRDIMTGVDVILLAFWLFSWILIGTIYLHSVALSIFGIRPWEPQPDHAPKKRFAVLIAAHNEEAVIKHLLQDLMGQDYPCSLYDVYVIADSCTDRTVEVARSVADVRVLVKSGPTRGKGLAIRTGIESILKDAESREGGAYGAFTFFDADNRVSANFLQKMNTELCNGSRLVQGYLGTKNPYDNWVTRVIYQSYAMTNRLWQLGKRRTGLPSQCGGTGFCIDADLLVELGWPMTTITEDLEMVCLLAQRGVFPVWSPEAVVYDEKPRSVRVAMRQRIRWMRGHFTNLFHFFIPLLRTRIRKRDALFLDCALYLL